MPPFQRSLFAAGEPAIADDSVVVRTDFGHGAWLDVARGWLRGADTLLDVLVDEVEWRQGRRRMYDRTLDDPRLSHRFRVDEPLPHPVLESVRLELSRMYRVPFGGVGLNYYRDGRDSVAPHADRELRDVDDALVAIVTLGARRPFLLRPRATGRKSPRRRSLDAAPASGDLVVMGGTCQRDWEHAVPKVAHAGPRLSMTWRWSRPVEEEAS